MTARFKTEKGFLEARKITAAIIALTRRRRGLEETAAAVIRIADDHVIQIPYSFMIETRNPGVINGSFPPVQPNVKQPRTGNLKRVSTKDRRREFIDQSRSLVA